MTMPPEKSDAVSMPGKVGLIVLFLLSFWFVWGKVDSSALYHYQMPMFVWGGSLMAEGGLKPGGLLDYAARFLAQFYQVAWLGSVIITGVLCLIFLATRGWLQRWADRPAQWLSMVPVSVLLWLVSRYDYSWLDPSLGLTLALGVALAYRSISESVPWLKAVVFCFLTVVMAQVAGFVPAGLFILFGGMPGLMEKQLRLRAGASLAGAVLVWILLLKLAGVHVGELWRSLVTGAPHLIMSALFVFYPIAMLAAAFFPHRAKPLPAQVIKGKQAAKNRPSQGSRLRLFAETGLACLAIQGGLWLAGAGLAWHDFDDNRKRLVQIDYYAAQEKWDRVLEAASRVKRFTSSSFLQINRALYHRGILLDNLFTYVQTQDFSLLSAPLAKWEITRSLCATLLELGQVNLAEHWAYEALEANGERPDTLRLLFKIHAVKGQMQVAREVLESLRKHLFQRQWAETMLARLDADPQLDEDPEIKHLRSVNVMTDVPGSGHSTLPMLQQLLRTNPNNRMAYEYLLAHLLLKVQPEKLEPYLDRLADFKYAAVPRHVEEGLLASQQGAFLQTSQRPPIKLPGLQIRPETQRRFESFLITVDGFKGNFENARAVLDRDYGNTFWHYSLYNQSLTNPPPLDDLKH